MTWAVVFRNRQFTFNLPTHYLCFVPVLAAWGKERGAPWADIRELESFARTQYPVLPAGFRIALAGAEKLGLVRVQGQRAQLTFVGQSVRSPCWPGATVARWAVRSPISAVR
jgi:hypothetical protein